MTFQEYYIVTGHRSSSKRIMSRQEMLGRPEIACVETKSWFGKAQVCSLSNSKCRANKHVASIIGGNPWFPEDVSKAGSGAGTSNENTRQKGYENPRQGLAQAEFPSQPGQDPNDDDGVFRDRPSPYHSAGRTC